MKTTYLSVSETAKLIRAALKRAFPGVKFTVRSSSYSGGASIRVGWQDGPADRMVQSVTGQFAGGGFDGSIDMAYSRTHWLMADGTTCVASDPGTSGSGGSHAPERNWMPSPDAKLVRFGADFVFTERQMSAALLRRAVERLARNGYPVETVAVREGAAGAYIETVNYDREASRGFDMEREVYRAAIRTHVAGVA